MVESENKSVPFSGYIWLIGLFICCVALVANRYVPEDSMLTTSMSVAGLVVMVIFGARAIAYKS
jgi:hypothetical protein